MTISVILYGRNDSHGYNLHKRAAISLNCIAEVLDHPDDEILFVDYNTPDDLPTFPEAIQDTLTEAARARLRILRVRPRVHARYAGRTHLVALEPVARNVALRRSRAENRWVLSTNTDMIFTPNGGASLSTIAAGLPDGFYHLPRFELPECLWETLDRRDPEAIIAATRRWATDFHLNEIVHGSETIVYDAPGDFQLALRRDLFAIDGFDEEMILGWHVDSNLAKRMRLLRGEVGALEEALAGYHCDHTRQATLMHRRDRVENDSRRFIDDLDRAGLPEQAATWGLADEEVEEIRLSNGVSQRYLAALRKALPEPQGRVTRSHYTAAAYNRLEYDWRHALPFLLDALSCCEPDVVIGYAGATPGLLQALVEAVGAVLPRARFMTPAPFDRLAPGRSVQPAGWDQWSRAPGVYVFEIGAEPWELDLRAAAQRSADVLTIFTRLALARRSDDRPPRVIGVNAVNSDFEGLMNQAASCPPTPYGSRVRHGHLLPAPVAEHGARAAGSRVASLEDWLDPDFARWADRFLGPARTGWAWERAAMLRQLDLAFELGWRRPRPRVLLVAHLPEALGNMLAAAGAEVAFADPLAVLGEEGAADWRPALAHLPSIVPDPVAALAPEGRFDAVLFPQDALMIRGPEGAGRLLAALHARLEEGGLLLFSLRAHVDPASDADAPRLADLAWGGFADRFRARSGYEPVEGDGARAGLGLDLAEGKPLATPSLWCWRKASDEALDPAALAFAFLPGVGAEPVDVTRQMRTKSWLKRDGAGWRLQRSAPQGHALFGPYIHLEPGEYRASVEADAVGSADDQPVLRLEIAAGGEQVISARDYAVGDLSSGRAVIDFQLADAPDGSVEVRLVHFGRADLQIGRVLLSRVEP